MRPVNNLHLCGWPQPRGTLERWFICPEGLMFAFNLSKGIRCARLNRIETGTDNWCPKKSVLGPPVALNGRSSQSAWNVPGATAQAAGRRTVFSCPVLEASTFPTLAALRRSIAGAQVAQPQSRRWRNVRTWSLGLPRSGSGRDYFAWRFAEPAYRQPA